MRNPFRRKRLRLVLEGAANLIEERGLWQKSTPATGGECVLTAIAKAGANLPPSLNRRTTEEDAHRAVAMAVGVDSPLELVAWNDASTTDQATVVAALRRAAQS